MTWAKPAGLPALPRSWCVRLPVSFRCVRSLAKPAGAARLFACLWRLPVVSTSGGKSFCSSVTKLLKGRAAKSFSAGVDATMQRQSKLARGAARGRVCPLLLLLARDLSGFVRDAGRSQCGMGFRLLGLCAKGLNSWRGSSSRVHEK